MKKMNIFYLAGLLIILIGTYVTYIGISRDSDKTIQKLKDSLNLKNEELQQKQISLEKKQDDNNLLQEKILGFQEKLDSNTNAISDLAKSISDVSIKTNQISNDIRNEQLEKGKFIINSNFNEYQIKFGGGGVTPTFTETRESLRKNGWRGKFNDIPFGMVLKNDDIFISIRVFDNYGNIIFDMYEGNWSFIKKDVFSVNYDSKGIEIINNQGMVVFQADLVGNSFCITGAFFASDHVSIVTPKIITRLFYSDIDFNEKYYSYLKTNTPKFVHHGESYLGKRLKK